MPEIESNTLRVLRGELSDRVPFWEVWFAMGELAERLAVGLEGLEARFRVARRLGWDVIRAGGVGVNCPGGASQTASDGTSRYVQGGVTDWSDFQEREWPDWSEQLGELAPMVEKIHGEGMAAVLYLPWAFHSIATALGWEQFAYKVYDDMGFLHAAFDWVEQRVRAAIEEVVIPARPDFVLFDGDCAYKTG